MITDGLTPFAVLAFLALVGGILASGVAVLAAVLMKHRLWARRFTMAGVAGIATYAGLLLVASLTSGDRVLAPGETKHICEIDCHIAYTVVSAGTARAMGGRTAQGLFHVITVRVAFDSSTIGPRRGMSPLMPGPREAWVVDRGGATYPLVDPGNVDSLQRSIVPGESFTTDLVFDLPVGIEEPKLLIAARTILPDRLMIGAEYSVFHGKVYFRIAASP
jgi:hypothetical protein